MGVVPPHLESPHRADQTRFGLKRFCPTIGHLQADKLALAVLRFGLGAKRAVLECSYAGRQCWPFASASQSAEDLFQILFS
jgi:hypothetical protein